MMRDIEFRAWSRRHAKYINPEKFVIGSDGAIFYADINLKMPSLEIRNWILEQYTGLKDKNDKKIFEGDIISYIDLAQRQKYFCVNYSTEEACFYTSGTRIDLVVRKGSVVGNIHQNADLLETE